MNMKISNTFLILLSLLLIAPTIVSQDYLSNSIFEHHSAEKTPSLPCGGPSNAHTIEIHPPGPVNLPADQSRILNVTIKDSSGNILGGNPDWSVSDGTIHPQGGGGAIYYPTSIGTHTVWACASEAQASIEIIVTMGTTERIELVGDKVNLTADERIEFQVFEYDIHGNAGNMFVPSSDWSYPEGSSLATLPGGIVFWYPGTVGNHTISVTTGGFSATWDVNVSRGIGVDLIIESDKEVITSDEELELTMSIVDGRGNSWPASGTWSTLANQASEWLTINGSQAIFDGHLKGNWTVHAYYNGSENGYINMSDEITVQVLVGKISLVEISGHDTTMLTGDELDLNPIATDLDGNIIESATFNWTIDGSSGSNSIDQINHRFIPTSEGQHNIQAEAGGKPASIRVQVGWSEPIDLNVTTNNGEWYLTVTTGETLPLHVIGLDVRGEWHTYNPNWIIDEAYGSIEESGGDGDYLYHSDGVNWTQLRAYVGDKEFTILVYVTPGALDNLEVIVTEEGVQGESVPFNLKGYDVSGNGVSIPICDVTVTSTAGRAECSDESWTLYLDNGGQQQTIKASYEGANGSGFIDVRPTLLGGQFGSSTQVIVAGAGLIAALITVVLIVAYLRVKRSADEDEDDDEYYDDELEQEDSANHQTNTKPHSPEIINQNLVRGIPPIGGQTNPPQGIPTNIPPHPSMMQQMGMGKRPVTPPPPAFMFGTGFATNSSSAEPVSGVFVRSDTKYGWENPSYQPGPGYGWEQASNSSVSIQPSTPKSDPPQPQWGDPGASLKSQNKTINNDEQTIDSEIETIQENDKAPLLTNALSMFNETSEEESQEKTENINEENSVDQNNISELTEESQTEKNPTSLEVDEIKERTEVILDSEEEIDWGENDNDSNDDNQVEQVPNEDDP